MKNLFVKFLISFAIILFTSFILFAATKTNVLRFDGANANLTTSVNKAICFSASATISRFDK